MSTASLKNYRQSPRKVRSVARLLKGKSAEERLLSFTPKSAAMPLKKLLNSAILNAGEGSKAAQNLFVKEIRVDGGAVLKRNLPKARGSSSLIRKRTSHVTFVLSEKKK